MITKKLAKRIIYSLRKKIYTRNIPIERKIKTIGLELNGNVIVPAAAPGGAGDDAMTNGAIFALKKKYPQDKISILVPKNFPDSFSFNSEVDNLKIFSNWTHPNVEASLIKNYNGVYILGADILDGMYNLPDSIKRIRLANICAEQGQRSRIIGFSLNEKPHRDVLIEFNRLKNVPLFLRDPLSYERAKKFIGGDVRLSADIAFLLEANSGQFSELVSDFQSSEKMKGQQVYGINIHSLLAKFSSPSVFDQMVSNLASLIEKKKSCSFVFIPHDYRESVDDRIPLQSIYSRLNDEAKSRVLCLLDPIRAAEIKEICKYLDGVLTGRMHLAIAALGVGTPVMGIVYQGKFEGTLSYFDLDKEFTMTPENVANQSLLFNKFDYWGKSLNDLSVKILTSLPKVKELSENNFM